MCLHWYVKYDPLLQHLTSLPSFQVNQLVRTRNTFKVAKNTNCNIEIKSLKLLMLDKIKNNTIGIAMIYELIHSIRKRISGKCRYNLMYQKESTHT